MSNVRTVNSDCCPDYFSHCEGLPLPLPLPTPEAGTEEPELLYQVGARPETVVRPQHCPHGVINVTGQEG